MYFLKPKTLFLFLVGFFLLTALPVSAAEKDVCNPQTIRPGHVSCFSKILLNEDTYSNGRLKPFADSFTGYSPQEIQSAYGIQRLSQSSGKGKTIAVVVAYDNPNLEKDLATFRSHFGLAPCTTANNCFRKLNQRGEQSNYPNYHSSWSLEAILDVAAVSTTCPNCNVVAVEADSDSFYDIIDAEHVAAASGADYISNSFGGPEMPGEMDLENDFVFPGKGIFASTGDNGFAGKAAFPSVLPTVTAVGGTTLYKDGSPRGWSERAWNGSGSGCSEFVAKPSWQKDAGCTHRTVADISMVGDPGTGLSVYDTNNGGWLIVGGTSLSAPLAAGYAALISQNKGASWWYENTGFFFDVNSGNNGSCSIVYVCTSLAGYDGPTGLGTPNNTFALAQIKGINVNADKVEFTANPRGLQTDYWIRYGETNQYGMQTSKKQIVGSSDVDVLTKQELSNLVSGKTYYFQVIADNWAGETQSQKFRFVAGQDGAILEDSTSNPPTDPIPPTTPYQPPVSENPPVIVPQEPPVVPQNPPLVLPQNPPVNPLPTEQTPSQKQPSLSNVKLAKKATKRGKNIRIKVVCKNQCNFKIKAISSGKANSKSYTIKKKKGTFYIKIALKKLSKNKTLQFKAWTTTSSKTFVVKIA